MAVATRAGRPQPPVISSAPARQLPWALRFYLSPVGRKWTMAVTGLMLVGFVIFHAAGNAKMFLGPEDIDKYGESLRDLGGDLVPRTHLLWLLRFGLIGAFALHIHAAYSLTLTNWKANGTRYQADRDWQAVNFASRSMRWTGTIILLYLFFHLADLTWGWWLGDDFIRGEVYHNIDASLSKWWVSAIYIVATVALSIHLFHGVYSMFHSLGVTNDRLMALRRPLSVVIAVGVLAINLSFPIAVLAGIVEVSS